MGVPDKALEALVPPCSRVVCLILEGEIGEERLHQGHWSCVLEDFSPFAEDSQLVKEKTFFTSSCLSLFSIFPVVSIHFQFYNIMPEAGSFI